MPIPLTVEQSQALSQGLPLELTGSEGSTFFLLSAEQYEKVRAVLEEELDVKAMAPYMARVFGPAGWDDPEMDIYDELDPRRQASDE